MTDCARKSRNRGRSAKSYKAAAYFASEVIRDSLSSWGVTLAGRKIFMLQCRTNAGVRRKPAIRKSGAVEEARKSPRTGYFPVDRGELELRGQVNHFDESAQKVLARLLGYLLSTLNLAAC
ncbi:hypothetical protein NKJ46_30790 [Mesorhizobium sp. M0166]|uniref:hypothetical protein n=1 Tax=Mesorhizobium sp. M0166 TaxID=2956902 RepID=UPI003335A95F